MNFVDISYHSFITTHIKTTYITDSFNSLQPASYFEHIEREPRVRMHDTPIGDFTVTSFAVSRGHPAPLVGKRLLAGGLRVYFCLYSCLVYINFAHTQDHDYVLYLCGGTSGVVWTACFSLLSSKKMENEENSG